jgi:ATP-dependent DNA helicase RecG
VRGDAPLRFLKGVGPRRAALLEDEGVSTVEDLLHVLPFRYEDRRSFARVADLSIESGARVLDVRVRSSRLIHTRRRGFTIFEAILEDGSGTIRALWYNQPYLERVLRKGRRVVLFAAATLDRYGREIVLENAEYELLEEGEEEGVHTGRIVPVYRKLADLSSRMQRTLLHRALAEVDPETLSCPVPGEIACRQGLLARFEALKQVHFPAGDRGTGALFDPISPARRTLAFEEAFLLQLALAIRRQGVERAKRAAVYEVTDALKVRLARLLPFRLTEAQRKVLAEIGADLRSPHPMNRLLQGDVGSGKTIVAILTLLVAVENGYQGALMVPTEILAEQHFRNLERMFAERGGGYRVELLTGSLRAADRRRALDAIAGGEAQIVVGTHALFESGVEFRNLAMVVVDEQHRFGVLQRAALVEKGTRPDVLVMTATPIPRTLALTLYGDLDLSVIDALPPGRTPVTTVVRGEDQRERVYEGIRREIGSGRQAYIVVPLVEETEKSDLKAVTAFAAHLRERVFPGVGVGLVHGKLKGEEKERTMREFAAGRIPILVATTVIEVGVDVPNASVMVVEHAERFGLSQLHQLRGRVGRGAARSYCVLMVGEDAGAPARERLEVMEKTSDGFRIAEKDFELRGPGAVFGTQQHGLSDLQFLAVTLRDPGLVDRAREEARAFVAREGVDGPEMKRILSTLRPGWRRRLDLAAVG